MLIENPLPFYCVCLFLILPFGYLWAYRISKRLFEDKTTRIIFSFGIFYSSWLTLIIFSGLITHSFTKGLLAGSIILASLGLTEYIFRRRAIQTKTPFRFQIGKDSDMWISGILSSLIIFYISIHGSFHDETLLNGHRSIIAQLQNNYFPPRNILAPDDALRYHFGFDVFCAALTAMFRCSSDNAIDITTTLSWLFCWIGLWKLGEKLFSSPRSGFLVTICALLGGGIGPLLGILFSNGTIDARLTGLFKLDTGIPINPPFISYFFQHPFAAGLPITITILFLVVSYPKTNKIMVNFIFMMLFIALYFCQTVLFLTLLPAITLFYLIKRRDYYFVLTAFIVLVILYVSKSGLLFTPLESKLGSLLSFEPWFLNISILRIIAWYIASFGLLLIFSIFGFSRLNDLKLFFATVILVSIAIPIFIHCEMTWDIVKFPAVAGFFMGILSGGAISELLMQTKLIRKVAIGGVAGVIFSSLIFGGMFIYKEQFGADIYYKKFNPTISDDYLSSINYLRTRVSGSEMVLYDQQHALMLSVLGGIPVVYNERKSLSGSFGFSEERRKDFKLIINDKPYIPENFPEYGIRWIISEDPDFLAQANLKSDKFRFEIRFGKLAIYRVVNEKKLSATIPTFIPNTDFNARSFTPYTHIK